MAAEAPNEVLKQHELLPPIAKIAPPSLVPKSFFTSICSDGTAIRPVSMATPQRWPVNRMAIMKLSGSFTDWFVINLNVCLAASLSRTTNHCKRSTHALSSLTLLTAFLVLTATPCVGERNNDMLMRQQFLEQKKKKKSRRLMRKSLSD